MTLTINADMGESLGIHSFGNDEALLPYVDTVNVACGMHAGDPSGIARTVQRALTASVTVGAHPGLPDLVGFGRREMALDTDEVRDLVRYQVGVLSAFLHAEGGALHHIKPHGALYGMVSRREDLMDAVCDVAEQYGVPVFGLAGTAHQRVAERRGIGFVAEFYPDLDYQDDGTVVVRRVSARPDLDAVERKVRRALDEGLTTSVHGQDVEVTVESICVHSDIPGAPSVAARLRAVLGPRPVR
ncbi:5-oxoprolinase subunit PxpA [Streptomyces sp. NPDC127068]|uniref:5-oxoprolinase subunit PxpA n=1 Tax=Streptomyces sp. NPDC127068 TaxID=3347127 RepID=UPI00365D99DC